jgi:hypothetical protein
MNEPNEPNEVDERDAKRHPYQPLAVCAVCDSPILNPKPKNLMFLDMSWEVKDMLLQALVCSETCANKPPKEVFEEDVHRWFQENTEHPQRVEVVEWMNLQRLLSGDFTPLPRPDKRHLVDRTLVDGQ